jgi:hypothetical protein
LNVKSKLDTEDEYHDNQRNQYMRGMCAAPLSLFAESTRMDASNIKGPKFLQKIFRAMGWKTRAETKE